MVDAPFRFLDLPKELRLMIYESFPTTTKHHALPNFNFRDNDNDARGDASQTYPEYVSETALVVTSLPFTGSFSTCRLIHAKAQAVLSKKLDYLMFEPIRIITGGWSLLVTTPYVSGLLHCLHERLLRGKQPFPTTIDLGSYGLGFYPYTDCSYREQTPEYDAIISFLARCVRHAETRAPYPEIDICIRSVQAEEQLTILKER